MQRVIFFHYLANWRTPKLYLGSRDMRGRVGQALPGSAHPDGQWGCCLQPFTRHPRIVLLCCGLPVLFMISVLWSLSGSQACPWGCLQVSVNTTCYLNIDILLLKTDRVETAVDIIYGISHAGNLQMQGHLSKSTILFTILLLLIFSFQ